MLDVCRLQQMGRRSVYVDQDDVGDEWMHEDAAAESFARAMCGQGVAAVLPPREGKVNMTAERDGLFVADVARLRRFNLAPHVMCASRGSHSLVAAGDKVAGTRAIPLYISREDHDRAMALIEGENEGPLFRVLELRKARAGILVTGGEVFQGLIEDRFEPIITGKLSQLGSEAVKTIVAPDEREAIREGTQDLLAAGADLIITTAGLSVDPDDVTRHGLIDSGLEGVLYGAPILPGAMTLLGRVRSGERSAQVLGVPACALYFKTTSLDILLPRLLAGLEITRADLADLADGGLCHECKKCTYPKCSFGR